LQPINIHLPLLGKSNDFRPESIANKCWHQNASGKKEPAPPAYWRPNHSAANAPNRNSHENTPANMLRGTAVAFRPVHIVAATKLHFFRHLAGRLDAKEQS